MHNISPFCCCFRIGQIGIGFSLQENFAQKILKWIFINVRQVHHGVEVRVPHSLSNVHGDDGDDGRGQRQRNLEEEVQIAASVNLRRFAQFFWQRAAEVGANQDDVVHRYRAKQNDAQPRVGQVQRPHHRIGGNQAAAEIHGEHQKAGHEAATHQIAPRKHIAAGDAHGKAQERGAYRVKDGVGVAGEDAAVLEHIAKTQHIKLRRKEYQFPAIGIYWIVNGSNQHIVQGVEHHNHQQDDDDVVDHVEGPVTAGLTERVAFHLHPSLPQAFFRQLFRNEVDRRKHDEVDHVVEQAHRSGVGILLLKHACFVVVGRNDLTNAKVQAVLQCVGFFKAQTQDTAAAQDEHGDHRGQDAGQINMPDALELGCTIEHGGLVQFGADGGQRRDVDDRPPARFLPDAGDDINVGEVFLLAHEENGLPAQCGDDAVDEAAVRREEADEHATEYHVGHEVRQEGEGLCRLFEHIAMDILEHDGQQDRRREARYDAVDADAEGVEHHVGKDGRIRQHFKPLHAHPLAACDAA